MSKSLWPLIDLAQGNPIRHESPESTITMTTTLTAALRKSTCKMEKRREGKEEGANAYLFLVATMWAEGPLVLPSQFCIGLIWWRGGCATCDRINELFYHSLAMGAPCLSYNCDQSCFFTINIWTKKKHYLL
jgi:hypothetical protein